MGTNMSSPDLEAQIKAQGDIVRDLKSKKAEKAKVCCYGVMRMYQIDYIVVDDNLNTH